MSPHRISNKTYLEQVKKILPDWDITIIPNDLMENPWNYTKVKITLVNQKNKITRDATLPLFIPQKHYPAPFHFGIITTNIAALVCKETQNDDLELFHRLATHVLQSAKRVE